MNINIPQNVDDILFKRVFGNTVFKQSLLYQYKVNGVKEFSISGDKDVVDRILSKVQADPSLTGIQVQYQEDQVPGEQLNRLYLAPEEFIDVCSEGDLKKYRSTLAKNVRQNAQTPVAKHINKRISIPLSKILAYQKIAPNMISLIAVLWALVGAFCLLDPRYYILGFACFQFNSILDGSDGEVAKFNLTFSELGKSLDVYCDYITTVLIIIFEFIGFYFINPSTWVGIVGMVSILCLILTAVVSILTQRRASGQFSDLEVKCHERLKNPRTLWDKLNSFFLFIGRRDFYILAIFLLALVHQFAFIHIFLMIICFSWFLLSVYTLRVVRGED